MLANDTIRVHIPLTGRKRGERPGLLPPRVRTHLSVGDGVIHCSKIER